MTSKSELQNQLAEILARNRQIQNELEKLSEEINDLHDEMDENDEQIERLESLIMQFEEDGE